MPILTIQQMKTHIQQGVQNIIAQGDLSILQDAIDAAIAEAKGYCNRYALETIFDEPVQPDAILLTHLKSMAKWHFIQLSTPAIDSEDAQLRYDRAIAWLKDIQSGKFVPAGWQPAQPEEKATFFHVKSNKKRGNHF